MALIYIYDTTETDKKHITEGLLSTDHTWEFVSETISVENINPEAEVVSVFVTSRVTREIIERLPKLRLIACRSTGFNNIDMVAASERGVTVVNVPTYGETTVAEYAFTLMLALTRKLPQTIEALDGNFDMTTLIGNDLSGKTLGVVGTGHIGQHAIGIAKGFGMKVVAYDPYPNDVAVKSLGFTYVSFDDLLQQSDVITIHAPYTKQNQHLFNADTFSKMKPTAILINTARGELVDTIALAEAVNDGTIAGAALDVIEGESLLHLDEEVALLRSRNLPAGSLEQSVTISALQKMDNVIITPHNAFNTIEAVGRINSTTCENIIQYWYGSVPNEVTSPPQQFGKLVIVRHAESEWNATGKWTGITDVHLSEKGFHEASLLGVAFKEANITLDAAYCSQQIRTLETLEGILNASGQIDVPVYRDQAINERDYGEYTGKNKWEVKEMVGEDEFQKIRRGWDHHIPGGESLKMVFERVLPFYETVVLPQLKLGKNIMLVAHGNSIRALIKHLEKLSVHEVESLEMMFGTILVYDVNDKGLAANKQEICIESPPPNA